MLGHEPVTPDGIEETTKLTVPWKLPRGETVITSDIEVPKLKLTSLDAGMIAKSTKPAGKT